MMLSGWKLVLVVVLISFKVAVKLTDQHNARVHWSTLFESLKSKRRLLRADDISIQIRNLMWREILHPFACYEYWDDFDLYAVDGHFVAAASHDPPYELERESAQSAKPTDSHVTQTKDATGYLYALDLRNHAVNHIAVSDQVERNKENDRRTLNRQEVEAWRQGAAKEKKVLYVWDQAGIDLRQSYPWKHQSGISFLSCPKDNMKHYVIGDYEFNKN